MRNIAAVLAAVSFLGAASAADRSADTLTFPIDANDPAYVHGCQSIGGVVEGSGRGAVCRNHTIAASACTPSRRRLAMNSSLAQECRRQGGYLGADNQGRSVCQLRSAKAWPLIAQ